MGDQQVHQIIAARLEIPSVCHNKTQIARLNEHVSITLGKLQKDNVVFAIRMSNMSWNMNMTMAPWFILLVHPFRDMMHQPCDGAVNSDRRYYAQKTVL